VRSCHAGLAAVTFAIQLHWGVDLDGEDSVESSRGMANTALLPPGANELTSHRLT